MPPQDLPENFSPWEHLQSVLIKVHNRYVNREFKDLEENQYNNLSLPRANLRLASLIKDDDSAIICLIRLWFFYGIIRKMQDFNAFYAIPVTDFETDYKYFPQITHHFKERQVDAIAAERQPVRARISLRWIEPNITETKARLLASKIKAELATPIAQFKKGRTKITYWDPSNGCQIILTVFSEVEAKQILNKILDAHGIIPDWTKLTNSESGQNFDLTQYKVVLGQQVKLPKRRPIATVWYRYSELKIHGLTKPVILCDTTGRYPNAYEVA